MGDNKEGPTATEAAYFNCGGTDPPQKSVDYFDQRVQNNTIHQLMRKLSRKKIQNAIFRGFVFFVFICSSDDITACSTLVRKYGPSVFFPIFVCAMVFGFPLIYLEMGLGQFTSSNPIAIFSNIAPIGAGIGYTMVIISALDVFRQAHLSTIFANILVQSLMPLFGHDFYMTRCTFLYNTDCIDPNVRCGGLVSGEYARQDITSTTTTAKFFLNYN